MTQLTETLKNIRNYIFRIFIWLFVDAKHCWITLLPFILIFSCFSFFPNDAYETIFRYAGLALEIAGILLTVYGLDKNLKDFDSKRLLSIIPEWFKRFPKYKKNIIVLTADSAISRGFSTSGAIRIIQATPGLEDRVSLLEKDMDILRSQLRENKTYVEDELKKLSDTLNIERSERESGDEQAKQALKKFAVEDVYLELMGIIWLIVGAILATASTELACFLAGS